MLINETLQVLSDCGLGAIVANDDSTIVEANPAALTLLHDDMLVGKALTDVAPCRAGAFCKAPGPCPMKEIVDIIIR